jgi:hypothetical protein
LRAYFSIISILFCTRRGQLNVKEDAAAPPPNVTAVRFKIHDYFTEEVT